MTEQIKMKQELFTCLGDLDTVLIKAIVYGTLQYKAGEYGLTLHIGGGAHLSAQVFYFFCRLRTEILA